MIDKKKLKDVMKKQDLKQEKPTDPSMTLDVKNEDVEAQIDLYLKEKTGENLNALIELMRTRRVLVPGRVMICRSWRMTNNSSHLIKGLH